jgi:hypothetical protein
LSRKPSIQIPTYNLKGSIMIAKALKVGAVTVALLSIMPIAPAIASGSMGGGASSGMKLGQSVYARKISCKSCKFPGGLKGAEQVSSALAMIDNGQIMLSAAERNAVKDYISKRFKGN